MKYRSAPRDLLIPIRELKASAYEIETDFPESDGTLEWDHTVLVVARVYAGECEGIGYTYADVPTAHLIQDRLADLVVGQDAFNIPCIYNAMIDSVRNLGRRGIATMAISAVDTALWDLKAKILDLPLVKLLGAYRPCAPIYGSGGFTSYPIDRLQAQLGDWLSQGISRVKMKVGRNPDEDVRRVRAAREAIGKRAELFVDANGAYTRKQALCFAEAFAAQGVTWFEEPVSSDDLEGLRLLRDRAPAAMDIAAGEYGYDPSYFWKMLESGAVDVLQADATRCGGITGFLGVAALCEAAGIPLSAHCAPSLHAHLGCALRSLAHVEYFHDHARIENLMFDGVIQPHHGVLEPDLTRPGLGIHLRRAEANRYAA